MVPLLAPLTRAVAQLDDRIFLGVLARCLAWALACVIALHVGAVWAVERLLPQHLPLESWLGLSAGFLASLGATLVASWLFLPLAAVIGTLYIDRIAAAVERRYYPTLPPAHGASLTQQILDGMSLGVRVLLLNVLALVLALILPGIGLVLGWVVAAYAIGRGLFVTVAMRRLPRPVAMQAYRSVRGIVLSYGGLMAFAAWVPLLNLFIPLLGTAAMVHILDIALTELR